MTTRNLILDYAEHVRAGIDALVPDPAPRRESASFAPGFDLPEIDAAMRNYYAAAEAAWLDLGTYAGHPIRLLDLARNPGTHTTKTFPSLLIIARAVEFTRRTGEPVRIFSPTSGNKGTALRDAVARAYEAGIAGPDTLTMTTLAPLSSRAKLRSSALTKNGDWAEANPYLLLDAPEAEAVKQLGKDYVAHAGGKDSRGANLWFSLDLPNYLVADVARAAFEADVAPVAPDAVPRTHVHAVSSAFGLLGYHAGVGLLEQRGEADPAGHASSLLVQHLGTPDMVLHLRTGSFDRDGLPAYDRGSDGVLRQSQDPHFPAEADQVDEILDPTFYTHRPATSPTMDGHIRDHGGDGIVVSRRECEQRYAEAKSLLATHTRPLPDNPEDLLEWSVVMAITGAFNAIDRGLVAEGSEVVIHGSGWYSREEVPPLDDSACTVVADLADLEGALR